MPPRTAIPKDLGCFAALLCGVRGMGNWIKLNAHHGHGCVSHGTSILQSSVTSLKGVSSLPLCYLGRSHDVLLRKQIKFQGRTHSMISLRESGERGRTGCGMLSGRPAGGVFGRRGSEFGWGAI